MKRTLQSSENNWKKLNAVYILFLVFYFYLYIVATDPYYWLAPTYFEFSLPIFCAFYIYFRGLSDGMEIRLLIYYFIWFTFSRILNGNLYLSFDGYIMIGIAASCLLTGVGLSLGSRARGRFSLAACLLYILLFLPLALMGIYSFIARVEIINPLTGSITGPDPIIGFGRLYVMNSNPNSCAVWFFTGFFLSLYCLYRFKKPVLRAVFAVVMLVFYFALGFTYSRTSMLAFSLGIALLVSIFILQRFAGKSLKFRLSTAMIAVVISFALSYNSFEYSTALLGHLIPPQAAAAETEISSDLSSQDYAPSQLSYQAQPEVLSSASDSSELYDDKRTLADGFKTMSGRYDIYKSVLVTFREEPMRLIRGCMSADKMSITSEYLDKEYNHFHNYLLDTLVLTGIPGFLLALLFSLSLIVKIVRVIFNPAFDMGAKLLTPLPVAVFVYCMAESLLFTYFEIRSFTFFLVCGIFLGYYYDFYPKKDPFWKRWAIWHKN